jgi:hypothetical protein
MQKSVLLHFLAATNLLMKGKTIMACGLGWYNKVFQEEIACVVW